MRSFVFGLLLLVLVAVTLLSLKPGGLRRQLRFAARRFRLALILAGIYVVATAIVRITFPGGPVAEWGPPMFGITLAVVFLVLGQDPPVSARPGPPPSGT